MPEQKTILPAGNPADVDRFFSAGPLEDLLSPLSPPRTSALEKLGASPFAKSRFPFLGFLASVYDHVAETASKRM